MSKMATLSLLKSNQCVCDNHGDGDGDTALVTPCRDHLNLKRHQCDRCDYKTNHKAKLTRHFNNVHLMLNKR